MVKSVCRHLVTPFVKISWPEIMEKIVTADQREQIESNLINARLFELYANPITGSYDLDLLKRINKHLFQDFPKLEWAKNYTPGEFRPELPSDKYWGKKRILKEHSEYSMVVYSNMSPEDIQKASDYLKNHINLQKLSLLKPEAFAKAIGDIYVQLDYLHPFPDGNSRTLREFTRNLSYDCGYNLDWSQFILTNSDYDRLYLGRDISVNRISVDKLPFSEIKFELLDSLDKFNNYKPLPELLKDAISARQWSKEQLQTFIYNQLAAGKSMESLEKALSTDKRVPGVNILKRKLFLSYVMKDAQKTYPQLHKLLSRSNELER